MNFSKTVKLNNISADNKYHEKLPSMQEFIVIKVFTKAKHRMKGYVSTLIPPPIFELKIFSAFYVYCIYSSALRHFFHGRKQHMDPDRTAPM